MSEFEGNWISEEASSSEAENKTPTARRTIPNGLRNRWDSMSPSQQVKIRKLAASGNVTLRQTNFESQSESQNSQRSLRVPSNSQPVSQKQRTVLSQTLKTTNKKTTTTTHYSAFSSDAAVFNPSPAHQSVQVLESIKSVKKSVSKRNLSRKNSRTSNISFKQPPRGAASAQTVFSSGSKSTMSEISVEMAFSGDFFTPKWAPTLSPTVSMLQRSHEEMKRLKGVAQKNEFLYDDFSRLVSNTSWNVGQILKDEIDGVVPGLS